MRARRFFSVLLLAFLSFLAACGGSISGGINQPPITTQPSTAPVTLTGRDAPPAGVTVLSFEITVTGAVVQPGNISLVNTPVKIELKRLEVETALLSTINAPAGTYTSVTVTLANPELTIVNNSGSAIGACADGAVCELRPLLSQGLVTFSGSPFPLTVVAGTPVGLLLDFNLAGSIRPDLSISPTVGFSLLPSAQPTGQLGEIEDLVGRVAARNVAANQFTIETATGFELTITVDANTRFEDFDEAGLANNFASILPGQVVEVDARLLGAGTLLAKKVELAEPGAQGELEGTIVSVNSATEFRMVITDGFPKAMSLDVGNLVTVQFGSGTRFRVDDDGLSIPSGLLFAGAADLLVGQNVEIRPLIAATDSTRILVQTDRIRLGMSRLTARVRGIVGSSFVVDLLPSLFTRAGINEIEVRTSSETGFDGVTGITGLTVGNTLSLRGLLFKTGSAPVLVAKKVRKR